MKLDVLLVTKNNELYWQNIFPKLYSRIKRLELNWYVYENNSTDKTISILKNLESTLTNFKVISETTTNYQNKYMNITYARERLRKWYLEKVSYKSEWIIMLDTNIIFQESSIFKLINTKNNRPDGKMFTGFTKYICNNRGLVEPYLYDMLAYNYGKYYQSDLIISKDITWENIMLDNIELNNFYIETSNDEDLEDIKVRTNFSGLVLIDRIMLDKIEWKLVKPKSVSNKKISPLIICEHWEFCDNIRRYGNIYIVKDTDTYWFTDNLFYNENIREIMNKLIF